ncbi:MAG: hypothetical protein IT449_01090 [Phycisphaerales bacterium]|nr:hypothetical protein [Phycisphaerales bacterium]
MSIAVISFGLFSVLSADAGCPQLPRPLALAIEARNGWRKAEFDWSCTAPDDLSRRFYFTSRYAEGDEMFIRRGSDTGCVFANEADAVGVPYAFHEWRAMRKGVNQYFYKEDDTVARIWSDPSSYESFYDVRSLGLMVDPLPDVGIDALPWSAFRDWEICDELGSVVVRGTSGTSTLTEWTLDPSVGFQPIRVSVSSGGGVARECLVDYQFVDGWPVASRISYLEGSEVWMEFGIESAVIDAPWLPDELRASDLGIPVGANIVTGSGQRVLIWDGEKAITNSEAMARREAGELDYTKFSQLLTAKTSGRAPGRFPRTHGGPLLGLTEAPQSPELWAEYTRRFISAFRFSIRQREMAWSRHKRFHHEAMDYLSKQEESIKAVEREMKTISPGTAESWRKATTHRAKLQDLMRPVATIFDNRLRPSLVELVTPQQKKEILEREQQQPGSTGLKELLLMTQRKKSLEGEVWNLIANQP